MKHSFNGLFVLSAIIMSFVLVQGVWAQADIVTLEGTVTTVENRAIGLDTNGDGETDATVYHMGPSWYWEDLNGVSYPETGDYLIMDAYDSVNGYVGVSVYLDANTVLQLRDLDTLKPLWTKIAETTDLFDAAAQATGNYEPIEHDYNHDYDHEYDYSYGSQGPHGK